MWLNRGTIDGGDNALDAMLAYLAHHHANRIQISARSNRTKMWSVRVGMVLGILATISFAACFYVFT
jgi:hypothetical protein